MEAGLTVIQEEIRMQLREKQESKNKSKEEKGARLRKIEKAVAGIASKQKAMARALTMIAKQLEDVGELRRELGDTPVAISELNRTLNDMHQKTREDRAKVARSDREEAAEGRSNGVTGGGGVHRREQSGQQDGSSDYCEGRIFGALCNSYGCRVNRSRHGMGIRRFGDNR